jgi:hypothetical protein
MAPGLVDSAPQDRARSRSPLQQRPTRADGNASSGLTWGRLRLWRPPVELHGLTVVAIAYFGVATALGRHGTGCNPAWGCIFRGAVEIKALPCRYTAPALTSIVVASLGGHFGICTSSVTKVCRCALGNWLAQLLVHDA